MSPDVLMSRRLLDIFTIEFVRVLKQTTTKMQVTMTRGAATVSKFIIPLKTMRVKYPSAKTVHCTSAKTLHPFKKCSSNSTQPIGPS